MMDEKEFPPIRVKSELTSRLQAKERERTERAKTEGKQTRERAVAVSYSPRTNIAAAAPMATAIAILLSCMAAALLPPSL